MTPHEKRVSIFETKDQYLQMKETWAKTEKHTNAQHMLYNILRGYEPLRGFSPLVNQVKIDNGGEWNTGGHFAKTVIRFLHNKNWEYPGLGYGWIFWYYGITNTEELKTKLFGCFGDINENILEKAYELAFLEAKND